MITLRSFRAEKSGCEPGHGELITALIFSLKQNDAIFTICTNTVGYVIFQVSHHALLLKVHTRIEERVTLGVSAQGQSFIQHPWGILGGLRVLFKGPTVMWLLCQQSHTPPLRRRKEESCLILVETPLVQL